MKKETVLEILSLTAGYGEKNIIEDLSFTLERGEIFCLA